MMTDPIGDMLARMKNAAMRSYKSVLVPYSSIKVGILETLEREGYINGFSVVEKDGWKYLDVSLRYYDGQPSIRCLERVSKPSRRVYMKRKKLPSVFNGFGIFVLSTSKGILSDSEAKAQNIGGEILCKVF